MTRTATCAIAAFLLVQSLWPNSAFAQGPMGPTIAALSFAPELSPDAPAADATALNASLRGAVRPNHWLSGGLIGAALLGVVGVALAAGLCDDDSGVDSCAGPIAGTALLGVGLGFTIGALVGGQIPKDSPAPTTP
jgi:hypothetical protein